MTPPPGIAYLPFLTFCPRPSKFLPAPLVVFSLFRVNHLHFVLIARARILFVSQSEHRKALSHILSHNSFSTSTGLPALLAVFHAHISQTHTRIDVFKKGASSNRSNISSPSNSQSSLVPSQSTSVHPNSNSDKSVRRKTVGESVT